MLPSAEKIVGSGIVAGGAAGVRKRWWAARLRLVLESDSAIIKVLVYGLGLCLVVSFIGHIEMQTHVRILACSMELTTG